MHYEKIEENFIKMTDRELKDFFCKAVIKKRKAMQIYMRATTKIKKM